MSSPILTPMSNASFADRMATLKQIANVTGIRLPNTIVPEGESLIPYGEQRKRELKEEIYSLPTLADAATNLREIRAEQSPRDVQVGLNHVLMSPVNGGIYGRGHENQSPLAYSETGFAQLAQFMKPRSVYSGFASTLLALPPAIRSQAFNHFAESNTQNKQIILRSTKTPALVNNQLTLRRSVNAVVSERYQGIEDYDVVDDINLFLPDGARARYTYTENRSDLEIFWPAMSRELKVGDIALIALQLTNSQTKAFGYRITPKILRVLCLNFTTAWAEGETEVVIRHVGEVRPKIRQAIRKALDTVAPFVLAFGDAYQSRFPKTAQTRGEVTTKFLKAFSLPEKFGESIIKAWDMDGVNSAGDTLAGLSNAVTRATQTLTIENAEPYERAAGEIIMKGWSAFND